MSYKIFDTSKKTILNLDLPNCKITGNSSEYEVKDGKIYKYSIINGVVDLSTKQEVSTIELTNYQVSVFSQLSGKDGDGSIFDHKDLKKLSKKELIEEMNDIYGKNNIYEVEQANVNKNGISLKISSNGDLNNLKNLTIEFEKLPNIFQKFFTKLKNIGKNKQTENEVIDAAVITERKKKSVQLDKLLSVYDNDNFEIVPEHKYTVTGKNNDTKPYKFSATIGISLDRLKEANPDKNMDWQHEIGTVYTIPKDYKIKPGSVKSVEDIAELVGLSKEYINDIILGLEGHDKSYPYLEPYYDNVPMNSKTSKGVLTIGFGHTGRIPGKYIKGCNEPDKLFEMNSENKDKISITINEAYELLAKDLLTAKIDAIIYFGESFLEAPKSIQDAIVDIVFNKGVETGLEKSGPDAKQSPTNNLYTNLAEKDYEEAVQNTLYATNLNGLKKRNVYRFILSIRDLNEKEQARAMQKYESYYLDVKDSLKRNGNEAILLENAWNNAKMGIFNGFF